MYPILFHVPALDLYVRTYWVVVIAGSLVALAFAVPRLRDVGIARQVVWRACALLALAAFIGGRVHHLMNAWPLVRWQLVHDGPGAYLLFAGMHSAGAIIGLVVAAPIVLGWYRLPVLRVADVIAPTVALGMAFGRFACFLNGCCYGTPCAFWWCVSYPEPSNAWDHHRFLGLIAPDATWSAPVHPLQLYFAAAALAIAAGSAWFARIQRSDGEAALGALLAFALSNAVLERFREDFALRRYWWGVPQLTWTALALAAIALIALLFRERGVRRTRLAAAPTP